MSKYRNVLTQTDFGPMIININDDTISSCISKHGYWGTGEITLIQNTLSSLFDTTQPMCLLDVGTNVGTHTLAFAKFPFPQVTVHGFEAQREMFYMVAGTVALNCLSNVYLHHIAVSNVSGAEISMPKVDYDSKSNFGSYELERAKQSNTADMYLDGEFETIKTICIDDLHLTNVRLIKIDVEGMEDKVVEGARHTIESQRPLLFIEMFKTDFDKIKAYLKSQHYLMYVTPLLDVICIPGEHGIGIGGAKQLI